MAGAGAGTGKGRRWCLDWDEEDFHSGGASDLYVHQIILSHSTRDISVTSDVP